MIKLLLFCLLSVVMVGGCTISKGKVVAKMGPFEITEVEVKRQGKINSLMLLPTTSSQTLDQLIDLRMKEWILNDQGWRIDERQLRDEAERIDKNTKDPGTLAKIKDVFGSNDSDYRAQYVRGILVARSFEPFFLADAKLHIVAKGKAESFLSKVLSAPNELVKMAQRESFPIYDYKFSSQTGFEKIEYGKDVIGDGAVKLDSNERREPIGIGRPIEEFLPWIKSDQLMLKRHEVFSKVIEARDSYLILQMLEPKSKNRPIWIRTVEVPKGDFQEWYKSERAKRL